MGGMARQKTDAEIIDEIASLEILAFLEEDCDNTAKAKRLRRKAARLRENMAHPLEVTR